MMATQSKYPWRAVTRTVFAVVVSVAAMAPLAYQAATQHDPALAGGWAAVALGISAAVTRVLAVPAVNLFLQRFVPWLAADPKPGGDVE